MRVIHNGLIDQEYPGTARPAFMDGRPFLFTIGDITPKKNFHVLVDLLARLPRYRLVVAGNDGNPYASEVRRAAAEKGLSERVVLPGIVSDESRYWLYKNCDAFSFPSLTEGFGLPVIEAMQFGKPVFCRMPPACRRLADRWPSIGTPSIPTRCAPRFTRAWPLSPPIRTTRGHPPPTRDSSPGTRPRRSTWTSMARCSTRRRPRRCGAPLEYAQTPQKAR